MASCGSFDLMPKNSTVYDSLEHFAKFYHPHHLKITVTMSIFSNVMNVLNFVVLTRPSMINSINAHLAAIAVADFLTLFLPFYWLKMEFSPTECPASYSYAFYLIYILGIGCFVAHSVSMWLSVFMAFTRFLTLRSITPLGNQWFRSTKVAWLANAGFAVGIFVINIPMIFSWRITTISGDENCTAGYETRPDDNCALNSYMYWQSGILFKIIPCVLLAVLSVKLLRILRGARLRRQLLSGALMIKSSQSARKKDRASDRTTKMMITMLVVFLACEIPQGLLYVLSGILGRTFQYKIQYMLGDVIDVLSQINCSINFVIYCTMSEAFRQEFQKIFIPRCLKKRVEQALSPSEQQTLLPKDNNGTKGNTTGDTKETHL